MFQNIQFCDKLHYIETHYSHLRSLWPNINFISILQLNQNPNVAFVHNLMVTHKASCYVLVIHKVYLNTVFTIKLNQFVYNTQTAVSVLLSPCGLFLTKIAIKMYFSRSNAAWKIPATMLTISAVSGKHKLRSLEVVKVWV